MESTVLVAAAALASAFLTNFVSLILYLLKERKSDKESREKRVDERLDGLDERVRKQEQELAVVDERTKNRETSMSVPIADFLKGDVRYERRT